MLDSLLEIKNAEDSAQDIVEKARSDMKRMLEDAEKRRDEIFSSTRSSTEEDVKKIKKISGKQAEEEAQKITQDGEKELEALRKAAKSSFSKGVELALSRVIG